MHMGFLRETYDAGCAAVARALETAAQRRHTLGRVTIFTDAQAAILRTTSDEPGPRSGARLRGQSAKGNQQR